VKLVNVELWSHRRWPVKVGELMPRRSEEKGKKEAKERKIRKGPQAKAALPSGCSWMPIGAQWSL
jgi:hypothetical protein